MAKIKMLKGLPGSGKTTLARSLIQTSGNAGRINRDDLRAMLFNSVWSRSREKIIVEAEKAIAKVLLDHNLSPLIDDTNLTPKHHSLWSEFARTNGFAFEVQLMDTPLQECIRRDSTRQSPVGEVIINSMALNAGMIEFDARSIVLVDIDGTLANGAHRENWVTGGGKKNWAEYYARVSGDAPHEHIVRWVNALAEDHMILIVSGRPATYQRQTLAWLRGAAQVRFDYLFMRGQSDKREDSIIKQEILNKLPKEKIVLVLDDRPRVVKMWRENGLKVIAVRGECDEF